MNKKFNSWFIGPKGENAKVLEDLLLEAFRDHLYWRRNYHPEDPQDIREIDKISDEYHESIAELRQYLFEALANIKKSVPFYSPRYIGHMTSDSLIPGIIGYISTMLYNTNNISPLGSPVTTPYEVEVGRDFARLMGYNPNESWGHITSGGTVANLEAMWVARNLKYLPIAIKRVAKVLDCNDLAIQGNPIQELHTWDLLCLAPNEALSLRERLIECLVNKKADKTKLEIEKEVDSTISKYLLSKIGWNLFLKEFSKELSGIQEGVVLVPKTKHYSWTKAMDIFGLGSHNLIDIDIDANYRMDADSLKTKIKELEDQKIPIIMVVAVLGSTEEGNIDPIKDIAEICYKYYKHVDAAYGGYFTTLLYDTRENETVNNSIDLGGLKRIIEEDKNEKFESVGVTSINQIDYLYKNLSSVNRFDSVTIDPHKLGYIPIPAGGVVFKDKRIRELISFTAPYAFSKDEENTFIGQFILEGSKPGASALACYLAHRVVPPTVEGYGYILGRTIKAARELWDRTNSISINGLRVIPIAKPDTNVFCFVVNLEENDSLPLLNKLNNKIYSQLSIDDKRKPIPAYNFLISKTEFGYGEYKSVATDELLERLGVPIKYYVAKPANEKETNEIVVLRMCAMNPWTQKDEYLSGFIDELQHILKKFVHNILIVEDEEEEREKVKRTLKESAGELHRFNYKETGILEEGINLIENELFDVIILDLMIKDKLGNDANGARILEKLRNSLQKHTPVVVYTQKDTNRRELNMELEDAGFNKDFDRCIYKKDDKSEFRVFCEIFERLF